MSKLNVNDLKVGQNVGVAHFGSGSTHSDGIYQIVKIDKVKIVVKRLSVNYERKFSLKTLREGGPGVSQYRAPFLETVEEQELRNAEQKRERELNSLWSALELAAQKKDLKKVAEVFVALTAQNA